MHRRTVMLGAAAIAFPAILRGTPAAAQGRPNVAAPALHRMAVGAFELTVVTDGVSPRNASNPGVVANASPEQVTGALRAAGFAGPEFLQPFNPTVLRTPAGLIAFDVGTGGTAGPQTGQFITNMRAAGMDPVQVVAVVMTHLHGDHFGGLVDANGTANFPNARILVPQREYAFWTDEGEESRARELLRPTFANVRRRFAPYRGRIETFAPGGQVLPGVTSIAATGHSPGHVVYLVADGDQQAMITGDAVHMPAFYWANPDWYIAFDTDPADAVATRKRLLDRLATDRIPTVVYHAEMPAAGRVERSGAAYRFVPANAG
jgi:glyoxylase-like metal-dependent hydrolase (beta-lactamase superfamily II)